MKNKSKKLLVAILVFSFVIAISMPVAAKPNNCPWCGKSGGYETYMQVTNYQYIALKNCLYGKPHYDTYWKLFRTYHEYCYNCKNYETTYCDTYAYYCPGNQPEVDPPPPFAIVEP